MSNSLRPYGLESTRLLCLWDFPGKNTGMGCHFILQGIFLTQGWIPVLLHCRQFLYRLSHQRSPWPSGHEKFHIQSKVSNKKQRYSPCFSKNIKPEKRKSSNVDFGTFTDYLKQSLSFPNEIKFKRKQATQGHTVSSKTNPIIGSLDSLVQWQSHHTLAHADTLNITSLITDLQKKLQQIWSVSSE